MARILTTVHLSDLQKEVLAKVHAAPTPQVAWEEISGAAAIVDDNLAAARDVLGNLGLMVVGDGTLEVTPNGEEVMKDENLIDDMGELTEQGQELAGINRDAGEQKPGGEEQPAPEPEMGGEEDLGLPMESLTLLRSIHEDAEVKTKLDTLKDA